MSEHKDGLEEILPCISCGSQADPADGFGSCTCGNEQRRADIQDLITEARTDELERLKEFVPEEIDLDARIQELKK